MPTYEVEISGNNVTGDQEPRDWRPIPISGATTQDKATALRWALGALDAGDPGCYAHAVRTLVDGIPHVLRHGQTTDEYDFRPGAFEVVR